MKRSFKIVLGLTFIFVSLSCVKAPVMPQFNSPTNGIHRHRAIPLPQSATELSGTQLYGTHCQACHGMLAESSKLGRDFDAIKSALGNIPDMMGMVLSDPEVKAIADALGLPLAGSAFSCSVEDQQFPIAVDTIRPLSKSQYTNTLSDLFGKYISFDSIALDLASLPIPQNKSNPFDNVGLFLSQDHFRAYSAIAATLSESLIGNAQFVGDSFGSMECLDTADLSRECLQIFAADMGKKIYRRPMNQQDLDTWLSIVSNETTARDEAKLILASMLVSGDFIFHMTAYGSQANAEDPGLIELTGFELASRLAYAIWGTMPDEELFRLAEAQTLKTEPVLNQQIDRLLSHPKARENNGHFYAQWLQLKSNLPINIPPALLDGLTVNEGFKEEIEQETIDFVNAMTFDDNGSYSDLMTSATTFPKTDLFRSILGGGGVIQRPGLLWRLILASSTFTSHRNLIHSGLIMRESLLCETLPQPPTSLADEVQQAIDQELGMLSTRDEVAKKTESPSCAGCHTKINPLAFAGANHYDWIGRYINEERRLLRNGQLINFPVDGRVEDPVIDAMGERAVNGPAQLARAIAASRKGPACFIQKRYAAMMGREVKPDAELDGCVLKRSYDALVADPNAPLLDVLKALLGPELNYRRIEK